MRLNDVSLNDKYDLKKSTILLNGTQAILRAMMMQHARDAQAGHNTAGFATGYRGSPIGGLDQQFFRMQSQLGDHNITFTPGLNEDLAATSLWGAQQAELRGEGRYDGVFGVWYGKGPGVDRSGDVFRHANLSGTSPLGGVLALMGDDHTCESSTTAHQSEFGLVDAMMPILNPAGVQELLDYALLGWALSRYSGCWVGLKCVKDNIESTAVVDGHLDRIKIVEPDDFIMPEGGLSIRVSDPPLAQERRLHEHKHDAVRAFARANKIDKLIYAGGKKPKIGIVTMGKSYLDVAQALDELGIDETEAAKLGLKLYKVGMVWPLEPEGIKRFAAGLDLIIVVEEKRGLVERQIKAILYGSKNAPYVIGKKDEENAELFSPYGALNPNDIALEVGKRLFVGKQGATRANRLADIASVQKIAGGLTSAATRSPYFCAGCPHNSSTVLPEGARGYAGIGCHWMVQSLDRKTEGYTHMGGEGANWIGEAPHSTRKHIFQNLGDGTYNHSGSLAIRAAMAAKVNITFKILFNDAVAMTGGQPHEGGLTVDAIAHQVMAEGVETLYVISDEPEKYSTHDLPKQAKVRHRDDLNLAQLELEGIGGVSVLIYDQTCAAEKRRRRKRGTFPDPAKRVFINELVCEGCGDCSVQSNCLAIAPVETKFGRKRQIDQSSCNKDYSCVNGFCPSFVTVHGGALRSPAQEKVAGSDVSKAFAALPEPDSKALTQPFNIVIGGVGGTGVVTIAALLGMAAHLEGKACGIIDMAGLSQKGGTVLSHVKIANKPSDIQAIRVAEGAVDFVLGCDLVVAGSAGVLSLMTPGRAHAAVNTHETMPADFTRDANYQLPSAKLHKNIADRLAKQDGGFIEASLLAARLTGNTISANLLLLGFGYQKGYLPVSSAAIEQAITLNGISVEMNIEAFRWGRRAAFEPERVREMAGLSDIETPMRDVPSSLDDLIDFYAAELTTYQNEAYGARYCALIERVRRAQKDIGHKSDELLHAVVQSYFKLLAYKDEYEVARLFSDGRFAKQLEQQFEGNTQLEFHLAPPLIARKDPVTGHLKKRRFGAWVMPVFRLLAKARFLRDTAFDPFGYTQERQTERRSIDDYEVLMDEVLGGLNASNYALSVELAALPQSIKGFGHVKQASLENALVHKDLLLERFHNQPSIEQTPPGAVIEAPQSVA